MAESSQLPPRARMKVHNSVTSLRSAAFDGASARTIDHAVLERKVHGHGRIIGEAFAPGFR